MRVISWNITCCLQRVVVIFIQKSYQLNNSVYGISVKESVRFFITAENTFKYLLRAKQLKKIVNVIK